MGWLEGNGFLTVTGVAPRCRVTFKYVPTDAQMDARHGGEYRFAHGVEGNMFELNDKKRKRFTFTSPRIPAKQIKFASEESAQDFLEVIDVLREHADYRNGVRDTLPRDMRRF